MVDGVGKMKKGEKFWERELFMYSSQYNCWARTCLRAEKEFIFHFCGRRIAELGILDRFMSVSWKVRIVPPSDSPTYSSSGLNDQILLCVTSQPMLIQQGLASFSLDIYYTGVRSINHRQVGMLRLRKGAL